MWICSSVQRVFVCVLPVLFRVKKTSFDSCGFKRNIFMYFFHVRNIRMLSSCKHQHAQAPVGSSRSRSQGWKGGVVVKLGPFARCADLPWPSHRGQRSPLRGCVRLCVWMGRAPQLRYWILPFPQLIGLRLHSRTPRRRRNSSASDVTLRLGGHGVSSRGVCVCSEGRG